MATKAERFAALREGFNKRCELERKNKAAKMMDVQTLWADLQAGLSLIFVPRAESQTISQARYMELYSNVYNCCCNLFDAPKRPRYELNGTRTVSNGGCELYERLAYFLNVHLYNIVQGFSFSCSDEKILKFYVDTFDDYTFSATVLNGMFSYLNRHWVRVQRQSDPTVTETYPLALSCWKNTLYKCFNQNVTSAILHLITDERKGVKVNRHLIRTVIKSYIELGDVDNDYSKAPIESANLAIYIQHFEIAFLEETRKFYIVESNNFLAENPVQEYMKKVERRLLEEAGRVDTFHHSTLPKLISICEQVMIQPHLELFYSKFRDLLNCNEVDDLGRLHHLVNRLNLEYIQGMSDQFKDHVQSSGLASLGELTKPTHCDPKEYFQKIFEVYTKFNNLVIQAFVSDIRFREALDKACTAFVNTNCVTVASGRNVSARLLAKCADLLLRKPAKNTMILEEDEMERRMENLMVIFRFLADKDVFQKYYSSFLASRLIRDSSVSDDSESSFIVKLRRICGQDYTINMQRMLLDIESSRNLSTAFKNWANGSERKLPRQFFVHVLNSRSWSFPQNVAFNLPEQLKVARTHFTEYYKLVHPGRTLSWLAGRSHGELTFRPQESNTVFTFGASTYQMAILLMFNSVDAVRLGDMIENTNLTPEIVGQVVETLTKNKILLRSPLEDKDEPVTEDSIFTLTRTFTHHRKGTINIDVRLGNETQVETERVEVELDKSRQAMLHASIVRIMKTRKTFHNEKLIAEVTSQIKATFAPTVPMVKNAIEEMIERNYIERDPQDRRIILYGSSSENLD